LFLAAINTINFLYGLDSIQKAVSFRRRIAQALYLNLHLELLARKARHSFLLLNPNHIAGVLKRYF
jgi:hypothetical protein